MLMMVVLVVNLYLIPSMSSAGEYKYFDMSRHSWTSEEDSVINRLVSQHGLDDWTRIADKLKEGCLGVRRTGKQCRERWYNHLSPAVSKKPWSSEEQSRLFQMHRSLGNRWKDISKNFNGRTDNDIKNHFYSTLRRSLRRLNKILGEKNSTSQMRQIKPSVLSTIMHCIYEQPNKDDDLYHSLKDLPSLIFEYANYKPIKTNLRNPKVDEVRLKIADIFELISRFNQDYQLNKLERKNSKQVKRSTREENNSPTEVPKEEEHRERIKSESTVKESTVQDLGLDLDIPLEVPISPGHHDNQQNIIQEPDSESHQEVILNYIGSFDHQLNMMEMQEPEQPSLISGTDLGSGVNLVVVGRHLQPQSWEKMRHEDFVDEVLE